MKIVVFKITGWPHGLLMNNPESMRSMSGQEKGGLAVKEKPLIGQEEADTKVYKDTKGFLRFPAMAFRSALIKGAAGRKFGKRAATTVVKGSIFPAEEWVQLIDAKSGKPLKNYDVHTCRVVNPSTRSGIARSRPHVKNWACNLPLEIDDEILPNPKDVLELMNHCGKTVGIGDYRPLCPVGVGGPYGRFSAKL